jgi:hypothetical protein
MGPVEPTDVHDVERVARELGIWVDTDLCDPNGGRPGDRPPRASSEVHGNLSER